MPEDLRRNLKEYEDAVAWATNALKAVKSAQPELFVPGTWEENEQIETGKMALKFGLEDLATRAGSDFSSHRAMVLGCANWLRDGKQLPCWAALWLADFLEGKSVVPPAPRGARSLKSLHHLVCNLIDNLVDAGWVALRNDGSSNKCACDALAEALFACGLQPATFEGVKRLYIKWADDNYLNENAIRARSKARKATEARKAAGIVDP